MTSLTEFTPGNEVARAQLDAEIATLRERIKALEDGVRKWASECGECTGTGSVWADWDGNENLYGPCPDCADIRALLGEKVNG